MRNYRSHFTWTRFSTKGAYYLAKSEKLSTVVFFCIIADVSTLCYLKENAITQQKASDGYISFRASKFPKFVSKRNGS